MPQRRKKNELVPISSACFSSVGVDPFSFMLMRDMETQSIIYCLTLYADRRWQLVLSRHAHLYCIVLCEIIETSDTSARTALKQLSKQANAALLNPATNAVHFLMVYIFYNKYQCFKALI